MDHRRGGLKLRELMVIVGIVGVVGGLVMRGGVAAREAGRRVQCQNNMRQLALGLLGFVNAKGSYPNAGTISDDPQIHGGDPTRSNIYRAIVEPEKTSQMAESLMRSWVVEIGSMLDLQCFPLWDNFASFCHKQNKSMGESCYSKNEDIAVSNEEIASIGIGTLRCPSDLTTQVNQGNLSYAVNGGFSLWPAFPRVWSGVVKNGTATPGEVLQWGGRGTTWQENQAIGRKLGVMFLGTQTGDQPWDIKTSPSDIVDGAAHTIVVGENILTGYSKGTAYSGGLPTNWACPLPNFCMFLAFDDVCRTADSSIDCLGGQLQPGAGGVTGEGWSRANGSNARAEVISGKRRGVEGSFPFANSGHAGGCNFGFCDGSIRFLSDTIDGKVYAELITPAGTALPPGLWQSQTTVESL